MVRGRTWFDYNEPHATLACAPQTGDDLPVEPHEAVQLALEQALLIAVRAEPLRSVCGVGGGPDAEALHAPAAELRHVGGAGAHGRDGDGVVDGRHRRFDRLECLGIEPRLDAG